MGVSNEQLSIVSNGNFPLSLGLDAAERRARGVPGGPASVGEVLMELGVGEAHEEPADHEMRLIRLEFEANLIEAGLEIERDKEVRVFVLIRHVYIKCKSEVKF